MYLTLLSIGTAIALFSICLYGNGGCFLPSSVLAKLDNGGAYSSLIIGRITSYWPLHLAMVLFCLLAWKKNKAFCILLISTFFLHMVFGKNGWFGRYEVYYIIFLLIPVLHFAQNSLSVKKFLILVLFLPLFFKPLFACTLLSPPASANIFHQQVQMAEVAKKLDDAIAVNDLGLVALRTEKYVLDLVGLGSYDALKARQAKPNNANWISQLMQKNDVYYAIIYDSWFKYIPSNWIKVGELYLLGTRITPASSIVSFYATSKEHAMKLKNTLLEQRAQEDPERYRFLVAE